MKYFFISARTFALAALALVGCKKDPEVVVSPAQVGTLTLAFTQIVGLALLTLGSRTYSTPAGDQFKITTFRQYLSNVKLTKADGSTYAVPDSYYLLDAAVPASQLLALKDIPVGDYQSVSFTVGVDSARNVAGAQTGALDPNNGMFWTWNSGYIYTKLEGTSPQAARAAGVAEGGLVFHIGGFKAPNNTIRSVTLVGRALFLRVK
ncbi:MbnP family protein [Hymenobacter sp. IS2118]|uniref:MbnP family protein n=1 Tax=Hymenobacter sp. IS2118 TaxID=1505605 RepID=UPI00068F0524|nr:MbnP family protein [Hymenobacter sp. IS2118]